VAIDVPENDAAPPPGQVETIPTPGATMSGLMASSGAAGPRDENAAI
jgi:hypothetical protein